ncbi:hypothetical protein Ssed_3018 [Shewanella sediminis HAW-EB3]|uniref:Uncharacterized protein n=1 Tax=Shewanella sediminis (strain HAW-EB3) TaxID=425104 RepID=A8FXP9_SHESH|nr:hypothetical protein [Shewanella sediminis]ABV37622.1 hypothetical protein Ssed_3018 [Shewanella sediminis HAW-EB3]
MEQIRVIFNRYPSLSFVILAFITSLLAYWPSFSVPFYLDDRVSIAENPLLLTGTMSQIWQVYGMRFVGYLSFWLNVQTSELNLFGFHLTNYAIHLLNGLLIFAIVKQLLKCFAGDWSLPRQHIFASTVALIWLLHPLNTQAVTYIVQRLASLVTLFYLVALYSYLKFRYGNRKVIWLSLFVFSCVLGLLTKQNFIVLFAFIVFYELIYAEQVIKKWLLVGFAATFVTLAIAYPFIPHVIEIISGMTKETAAISRYDYFVTQTLVIWEYILKFFIPYPLQLDMGVDIAKTSSGIHFAALLAHLTLILSALFAAKHLPLFSVGIIVFYTGHSVESFVIPITDLAFEHRTYLPNIGLTLAVCGLLFYISDKQDKSNKIITAVILLICGMFAVMTFERNTQWQEPYAFAENEYNLEPDSPRAMTSYALELVKVGELAQAEKLLVSAVNSNMQKGKLTVTSINNLMLLLFNQGKYQSAVNTGMMALKYIKRPNDRSLTLSNIAYGYIKMGYCDFAIGLTRKAIKLDAHNENAKNYLNHCLSLKPQ